jgi:uncharacterized metal-binding protein YceD (DUF177 family)
MKINVRRIPLEGEKLAGQESAAIMKLDEPGVHFRREVSYRFFAQVQGNALLVTGTLDVPATLQCSRCLREFEQSLHVGEFVFHQELQGEDFVDLTASMREDIILELPQRALCAEDCKGLCPQCGQDLNRGPCRCKPSRGDLHWHALDRLKLK